MPQIVAWQCAKTERVFTDKKDYTNHLRRLAEEARVIAKLQQRKDTFYEWLKNEKSTIVHTDMIVPWILENQQQIMNACNDLKIHRRTDEKFLPGDEFTSLVINFRKFSPFLSNSHSCPKGGVTNWCNRVEGAPTGYPGYGGRICGSISRKSSRQSMSISGFFSAIDIHTGTGGCGSEKWAYDMSLFESEWPGLIEGRTFSALLGNK